MRQDLKHIQDALVNGAREVAEFKTNPVSKAQHIGIKHLGNEHVSLPVFLHLDPVLEPVDKTVYSVIRILSPKTMSNRTSYPTYDEICQFANIGSHATVSRALHILRITRWIIAHQVIGTGGIMANVYMTNDQPMDIQDLIDIDRTYLDSVALATKHHHNRVRKVAQTYLMQNEENTIAGINEAYHPVTRALESTEYLKGNTESSYFGINNGLINYLKSSRYNKDSNELSSDIPTVKGANTGSSIFKETQEPPSISSLNIEENKKRTKNTSLNIEERILAGSLNIKEGILGGSSNIEEPSSSCSSIYKTTTTTKTTKDLNQSKSVFYASVEPEPELQKLVEEKFSMLNQSQHYRIGRLLMRINPVDRKPIINEVSHRLKYTDKIRNPIGYLGKLCHLLKQGEQPFSDFALEDYKPNAGNQSQGGDTYQKMKKELAQVSTEMSAVWSELQNTQQFQETSPNEFNIKTIEKLKKKLNELRCKKEEFEFQLSSGQIKTGEM